MSIEKYLEENKNIQKNLLDYLESEVNVEEKYHNLKDIFDDIKIYSNHYQIKSLLYLISKISSNHYHTSDFYGKIEQILQIFKESIKNNFSNSELFHIFKSNKRLLLFLFEEKLIIMDDDIVKIITNEKYSNAKYPQYFQPEIQPFINKEWISQYKEKNWGFRDYSWINEIEKDIPENFYQKRKICENDDKICIMIQKDLIEEFITDIKRNLYSVTSEINQSIFETNNFLLKNNTISLIEYATFYGSAQIFNYLRKNGAELTSSLWLYAVHGQSEEIIHILEENKIFPNEEEDDESFELIFKESIKCHHIDVANYIQSNYLQDKNDSNDTSINGIKYYNFFFIQYNNNNNNNNDLFWYSCKYDNYLIVDLLLKKADIDINMKIIYVVLFYSIFISKKNNYIFSHIIQLCFQSFLSIKFKIRFVNWI